MFYYLTVSYDIGALVLSETSYLSGPYPTAAARDAAAKQDMEGRDLECGEIVNVTHLKLEDSRIVRERSYCPACYLDEDDEVDDE